MTATDTEGLAATQSLRVTVPNRAPRVTDTLPDIELVVGGEASAKMSHHFVDPDGDGLTYRAESSQGGVAGVAVSGDEVVVRAVAKGTATIEVSATDTEGLTARLAFSVRVPNRAPSATEALPDVEVEVGEATGAALGAHFADPDGDILAFAAESSHPAVATVSVSANRFTVTAVSKGTATITVTATDPEGLKVAQSFRVTVPNRAPEAANALPDLELHVGEESATDMSAHFVDPDGDTLSFAVESSDTAVAKALVRRGEVQVRGGRRRG